ncbi:hypothetical protein KZ820_09070 [Sphingomonas sp. RRHST34]|uniref:Uncharacterized protein n=1 Tax=Sphingomonas citri TaxID=2862499 RepID=A0ABS7BN06_9SPHN|nr:hypothetical protein [Sphingomonas citri]MBW6530885.1 hypothetical protein [Sphingomonas citri]
MAKRKRYLTATLSDGYVKTIGPTAAPLTHYWRIVAQLHNGRTEVFWGHEPSQRAALAKRVPAEEAAKQRGWRSFEFEVVALQEYD